MQYPLVTYQVRMPFTATTTLRKGVFASEKAAWDFAELDKGEYVLKVTAERLSPPEA